MVSLSIIYSMHYIDYSATFIANTGAELGILKSFIDNAESESSTLDAVREIC